MDHERRSIVSFDMPQNALDWSSPPFDFAPFAAFWRDNMSLFAEGLYSDVIRSLPSYAQLPREDLISTIKRKAQLWQEMMVNGDPSAVLTTTRSLGTVRVSSQVPLRELMATSDLFRKHVWIMARRFYDPDHWPVDAIEQIEEWTKLDRGEVVGTYSDLLRQAWDGIAEREQALEQQRRMIHELAAPIVSIYAGVVLLPLVGHVDENRAMQVLETALDRIVELQAEILLLDITGVPVIDTTVAHYLLKLERTVTLLGAQTVLVGMSPHIAATVVNLGIDLERLVCRADLAAGIQYALACLGYAIRAAE
jgi:rsbT co-antagonist protein RsbR